MVRRRGPSTGLFLALGFFLALLCLGPAGGTVWASGGGGHSVGPREGTPRPTEAIAALPPPQRTWIGPDGRELPFRDDDQVIDFLRTADVVDVDVIEVGVTRPKKMLLRRGDVRAHAVFRYSDIEHERIRLGDQFHMHFRDKAISEAAAYALARLLGLDSVPPTTVRRIDGVDGTLQLWVEGCVTDADRIERAMTPPVGLAWFRQTRAMAVFDRLIQNIDRNNGNMLIDGGWKLWLIDHTRAFQRDPRLHDMDDVNHIEGSTWRRLRRLGDDAIRSALVDYLPDAEIEALLERRAKLVDHFERLISERGVEAVVI